MKLKILNIKQSLPAYTMIELLIVFSIIVLFSVLTIPSYINFNRSQEVKQSALFIKSQLRDAQNRSQSGEKDQTLCTLTGFNADFKLNQNTFSVIGSCNDISDVLTLPSKNVKIVGFFDASSYPGSGCSVINLANDTFRIFFKNLNKGTAFYDWNSVLGSGTDVNYQNIAIKVADTNTNSYFIIISKDGEIYEVKSC